MEDILKQITWHLNVIATELKRYNDAQNYPPSKLTENIERKKQKASEDEFESNSDIIRSLRRTNKIESRLQYTGKEDV